MSKLLKILNPEITQYRDRKFRGTQEEWEYRLATTTTLYIGNLSFYTTEEQVYEIFSKIGRVKRIVMGLDKQRRTPCGFCFVEYYLRADADDCVAYLNGTLLDERPIRVDIDYGFEEGRQYGRGRSGGQVRDEYRTDFDEGRGGYGKQVASQVQEMYASMEVQGSALEHGFGDGGGAGGALLMGPAPPLPRQPSGAAPEPAGGNPRFRREANMGEDME